MALLADGSVSFRGGQNDAVIPSQIAKDQYRKGINVTTDRGVLGPRPGFRYQPIEVKTRGGVEQRSYQQIFDTGKFQAAFSFDSTNGDYIAAAISGIVFRIDPMRGEATVVPFEVEGDRLSQYRRRIPWSYAGKQSVFFDYPNRTVVLGARRARRANPETYEVPTAVLGAFNQNRLWIANDGSEFGAGDPVGGVTGAPITFFESLAPAAEYNGQFLSLGSSSQNKSITAMGFLKVADSSTGMGPLL